MIIINNCSMANTRPGKTFNAIHSMVFKSKCYFRELCQSVLRPDKEPSRNGSFWR